MTSALFTDFYELTMAQGYWKCGMNEEAVFDVFFRREPFSGGFSVLSGVATLVQALESFRFSPGDIDYLRSLSMFEDGFLEYLKGFKFTGDVWAMDEGRLIFPQEPLIRVHAPLIQAQIVEGLVLNCINFQSLIATKTCRVWLSCNRAPVMEFGLRRAQGFDGALSASRAAFIGGASGTSNTLAGKMYGIPVQGTMAHSWVMSFNSELEAFRAYARLYPSGSVFLIDTYDTLNSGIKNAIIAGRELVEKGYNFGVRLDSGDMSYLTSECRRILDEAGLKEAKICVSNELTEEIIEALVLDKAPIDSWGVGTHMVTGGSESSFTGVYKLCAKSSGGNMIPTMKFSDNPAKTTNPGIKSVFRLYDKDGMMRCDILALEGEEVLEGREDTFYHPMVDYRQFSFSPSKVVPLLHKVIDGGKSLVAGDEKALLLEARGRLEKELLTLDKSYERILNPHIYKVSVTKRLKDLKLEFIRENVFRGSKG